MCLGRQRDYSEAIEEMSNGTSAYSSQEPSTQPQSAPPSDQHDPKVLWADVVQALPRGEVDAQPRKGSPAHRNNFYL